MINIENTDVFGFESAIRGMRNPMNSWEKSDSGTCGYPHHIGCANCPDRECGHPFLNDGVFKLGINDLKLMRSLVKAGSDHSKFMRMINVTCDIVAPLYWWKEFDTYKVGTVRNSCSTMHKIHSKEFTLDDFSCEHLNGVYMGFLKDTIRHLNQSRELFINSSKKEWWWQMIQLLPSSYNQRATVQLNYAVLRNMYHSRKNHKLDEWIDFCKWVETLPYAKELIID